MPRKRKTATGYDAQDVKSVAGQRYGEGTQQAALQRVMPAPNVVGPSATPAPAAAPAATPAPAQQAPMTDAELMQIASQMKGQAGLLTAPTNRPNEPLTAGLPSGPGPGPEAMMMRQGSPTAKVLRDISRATGDSYLADLAARSRM